MTSILRRTLLLFLLASLPALSLAAMVTGVQRGVHEGFELVILHCDSLPDFSLEYDHVRQTARLALTRGRITLQAAKALTAFRPGVSIAGVSVDRKGGMVTFRLRGDLYLREHIVNGPAALILDFSSEPDSTGRRPFELDRDQYLKLGGTAERRGDLELALKYVSRVRRWSDDDHNLVHRSGVIEQRLGRWDVALETFAKTAADPQLAADAHARRTMIFMAKGDTSASGAEWAGYFHAKPKAPAPDSTSLAVLDTTPKIPGVLPQAKPRQNREFTLPKILQAGGGDSETYLYYGWGMLAVGLLTLMGLWWGSGKARKQAEIESAADQPIPAGELQSEYDFLRSLKPKTPSFMSAAVTPSRPIVPRAPTPRPMKRGPYAGEAFSPAPPAPLVASPRIVLANEAASVPNPPALHPSTSPLHGKAPVDQIIALADSGLAEPEIANELQIGQDEVSMTLNLSRLARKGAPSRDS